MSKLDGRLTPFQHHTTPYNTVEHQKTVLIFKQELCCEENISFYSENMLGVLMWCVWCSNFEHYGILLQNVWMILLFIRLWKFKLSMTCRRPHILWAHFVICWAGNISNNFNIFYWDQFWHFYTFIFSGTHISWL